MEKRGNLLPMGRIFRFKRRPRRQWRSSAERRGWKAANAPRLLGEKRAPAFWPRERTTVGGVARETMGWLRTLRPFILGAIALSIWPTLDPALVEPPAFLSSEPERVSQHFTRCGPGRGHACVIDGDTFKLGQRKIRIIGIDAPETHEPRCAEEARLGELATARLQALLNAGPFEMVARFDETQDRYGRDLRVVRRVKADGSHTSIAGEMRQSGLARRYLGRKGGWC